MIRGRTARARCLLLAAAFFLPALVLAIPRLEIKLGEVETRSLEASDRLKAARFDEAAAIASAASQDAALYPKLSLEGTYRYLGTVPSLQLPAPINFGVTLGAHDNYSVGPTLSWIVWDFGSLRNSVKGLEMLSRAKEQDKLATKRQVMLSARQAYFRVQLAIEQLGLVDDSLKLARAQYRDIANRLRAGASARVDLLQAHREVLSYEQQFRQSQSDLASSLQDLFSLTGAPAGVDVSVPETPQVTGLRQPEASGWRTTEAKVEGPTVLVSAEPIAQSLQALEGTGAEQSPMAKAHPIVESYARLAQAMQESASAVESSRWPKLSLSARSSLDFPNGPILERFNQNQIGVNLTWSLWDWGVISQEAQDKHSQAEAALARKNQSKIDLSRDWNKAHALLAGYRAQEEIFRDSVKEADQISRLVYGSYKVGRSTFLEVQSANLRALEAKVNEARNRVQILNQLALLASLAEKD